MINVDGIEYAYARMCARNGERPSEAEWRRIEVVRELGPLLDAARHTRLGHWTAGIAPQSGAHEIESTLRGLWRTLVADVSRWMPGQWSESLAWCGILADLPMLQHVASGEAPPPWMNIDPRYRELVAAGSALSPAALMGGAFAPLAGSWAKPSQLLHAWRALWLARLPRAALAQGRLLGQLVAIIDQHLGAFGSIALTDGWPLRRALQLRLTLLFRGAVLDPAAAFAFLALSALDLERLRGELVRRAAFPRSALAA